MQFETSSPPSRLKVAFTILFHSCCAIWSTLVSKSALNSIESPILLLSLQFTVQVFLLTAIGVPIGWIQPVKPFSKWKSLLPLTMARMTGILAKTFFLASVNTSFYQIARGLLLPFTLLLSYLILRPTPYFPPLSLFGAATVVLGFVFGMASDFSKKLTGGKGLLLGMGSSLTTAVESVIVKRYLSANKAKGTADGDDNSMGVWQMVWMSNVMSLFLFVSLLIVSGETANLSAVVKAFDSNAVPTADSPIHVHGLQFVQLALMAGLAGFLLTIATFLQIEVTSPTTHMIVTAARGVAQSSLAVVILLEPVTTGRVASMAVILSGSAVYGWARDRYTRSEESKGYKHVQSEDTEKGEGDNNLVHGGQKAS